VTPDGDSRSRFAQFADRYPWAGYLAALVGAVLLTIGACEAMK
jgi:hypothetical protein